MLKVKKRKEDKSYFFFYFFKLIKCNLGGIEIRVFSEKCEFLFNFKFLE